jgi:CheY-like chemotaxis protein
MDSSGVKTVLLVDDEDLVRMVGADILEQGGFKVIEAANASEALAYLERDAEVMVLFTDVNMPGTPDGFGLAKLVHERWPQVKILVASGQAAPGPDDLPQDGLFLSKPYRADDLLTRLRQLIAAEKDAS